MLRRQREAIFSTVAIFSEMFRCLAMMSSVIPFLENLRIEMLGPSIASGGMMMLTRLPSSKARVAKGLTIRRRGGRPARRCGCRCS